MTDEEKFPETPGDPAEEPLAQEGRRTGPTWRAWILTILVAVVLSVSATMLLGGSASFRPDAAPANAQGGCGGGCCGDQGK